MKLHSEDQLLDIEVRRDIIKEIRSSPNVKRKKEALRRHEVYKDRTKKFVMEKLEAEGLKKTTLAIMKNRASNISICKKIINKLARAYNNGLVRDAGNDETNTAISYIASELDIDSRMKKADKYLRLQKNCLLWLMPERVMEKWIIKLRVMGPWQYDAVESVVDADIPLGIVLSDFNPKAAAGLATDGRGAGANSKGSVPLEGTNAYQEAAWTYIFWSNNYHFTCDKDGTIIASLTPDGGINPFAEMPGIALAQDRDECFWAEGGEDLIDGSILVNTLLTDMNAIQMMQGWGQFVVTGPKGSVPKVLEGGPHNAWVFTNDTKKDQGEVKVSVVSGSPQTESWMRSIEQFVALLLSTNNLSPRTVATKLDASTFPSGIAMLIESSDSTEDVKESQHKFSWVERIFWKKYTNMHNFYADRGLLADELQAAGKLPPAEKLAVQAKFNPSQEVVSEGERLDNMAKKDKLGIISKVDMMMQDNPGMTEEEAQKKLLKISGEKVAAAEIAAREMANANAPGQGGGQSSGQWHREPGPKPEQGDQQQ